MSTFRIHFIVIALLASTFTAHGIEDCQLHLAKLLRRLPPESTRTYPTDSPTIVNRLDRSSPNLAPLLHPNLRATIFERGPIDFSVIGTDAFQKLIEETNQKGFWVLYSPAPETDRNPVGHTSLSINDIYFTGQYAMQSLKGVNARLDDRPYVVAQFFELSEGANAKLDKFLNDRIWYYHQGHPDFASNYAVLPFSKNSDVVCGENCITSNFGFLEDKWIKLRPELSQVRNELGTISVSEIPNRQVWLNTESPAYRGAVIVTHKPEEATEWITKGDFNSSHSGKQLLFDGRPVKR